MRRQKKNDFSTWLKKKKRSIRALSKRIPHFKNHLPALAQDMMNSPFSLAVIVFLGAGVASMARLAERHGVDLAQKKPSLVKPLLGDVFLDKEEKGFKLPTKAWDYFKPVWKAEQQLLPIEPIHPEFELADKAKSILSDPKNKIESDFKVPDYLKERVGFWILVHTVFGSKTRVVHDRFNPGIVYGFIDFRPLYRIEGPGPQTETKVYRLEKQILSELKEKMLAAGKVVGPASESEEEVFKIRDFLSRHELLGPGKVEKTVASLRTQTGQSDEFISALHRSKQLLPHIESVFRRQGLPVALGRIPFVESSFNARAASKVGAVGVWQFMPDTARQMISSTDQKAWADPLKQTTAATKLFKIYRSLLPDWGTAVTSYNSGVGRLQRLVKKHKARDLSPIIGNEEDEGLGFAGKNFYAQFLSANLVEAYKDELFGGLLEAVNMNLVFKGMDFPNEKCDL